MKKFLFLVTIPAFAFGLPIRSFGAADKPAEAASAASTPAPEAKVIRAFPFHGEITTVDAAAKNFTIKKDGFVRNFHVGESAIKRLSAEELAKLDLPPGIYADYWTETPHGMKHVRRSSEVKLPNAPVDFSAITVGAHASGYCTKTGERRYEIVMLQVEPKPVKTEKAGPPAKAN